jgi:(S)-mandelate dehydrogenase
MKRSIDKVLNISDLRTLAKKRLPPGLFSYLDHGSEDERTMSANRSALEGIRFLPRVCVDVRQIDQTRTCLGFTHRSPIAVGPTGLTSLLWPDGETQLAKATADAGVPFTAGIFSLTSVESLAEIPDIMLWAQTYWMCDETLTFHFIERARNAGIKVLLITADMSVPANREYAARSHFSPPLRIDFHNLFDMLSRPAWLIDTALKYWISNNLPTYPNLPEGRGGQVMKAATYKDMRISPALNWHDIARIRKAWPHALVLKGISNSEDAVLAVNYGLDGIVVSNHGGRALDGTIAAIDALPAVVDRVRNKIEILIDGGFRRGSDVVKALALGATAVLLGRPTLYGAAAAGYPGAAKALSIFKDEIQRVLGLLGCCSVSELSVSLLDCPSIARPSLPLKEN